MKKLEDIPKKEVFNTPDGYFDSLPTRIQSRIQEKNGGRESRRVFQTGWKLALPAVVLMAMGVFWFTSGDQLNDAESVLASVETTDLVAYLDDSELSVEELIEAADFNAEDLDEIEGEVYDLHQLDLDSIDIDKLELGDVKNENEGI